RRGYGRSDVSGCILLFCFSWPVYRHASLCLAVAESSEGRVAPSSIPYYRGRGIESACLHTGLTCHDLYPGESCGTSEGDEYLDRYSVGNSVVVRIKWLSKTNRSRINGFRCSVCSNQLK